jgi:hypothetical protein
VVLPHRNASPSSFSRDSRKFCEALSPIRKEHQTEHGETKIKVRVRKIQHLPVHDLSVDVHRWGGSCRNSRKHCCRGVYRENSCATSGRQKRERTRSRSHIKHLAFFPHFEHRQDGSCVLPAQRFIKSLVERDYVIPICGLNQIHLFTSIIPIGQPHFSLRRRPAHCKKGAGSSWRRLRELGQVSTYRLTFRWKFCLT